MKSQHCYAVEEKKKGGKKEEVEEGAKVTVHIALLFLLLVTITHQKHT